MLYCQNSRWQPAQVSIIHQNFNLFSCYWWSYSINFAHCLVECCDHSQGNLKQVNGRRGLNTGTHRAGEVITTFWRLAGGRWCHQKQKEKVPRLKQQKKPKAATQGSNTSFKSLSWSPVIGENCGAANRFCCPLRCCWEHEMMNSFCASSSPCMLKWLFIHYFGLILHFKMSAQAGAERDRSDGFRKVSPDPLGPRRLTWVHVITPPDHFNCRHW